MPVKSKKTTHSENEEEITESKIQINQAHQSHKKNDDQIGIDENEFCSIIFDHEWPYIIKHLADILMGGDILKSNKIIEEEDQANNAQVELFKENEINLIKNKINNLSHNKFCYVLNAF